MAPYPTQTRYVKRACAALGLAFTDLDGAGYLYGISDGRHEIVSGSGPICAYPLNSASAYGVSRDKHHTNAVLARAGLPTIPEQIFFLDERRAKLREGGHERADAFAAFVRAGGPVFCKPNQGSHGDFAEIVSDDAAFRDYVQRVTARYDTILLQPVLDGDEYRIFCLDGETVFATRKAEFAITGDGKSTLSELVRAHNAPLVDIGISPVDEAAALAALALHHNLGADHIPPRGEKLILPGRRNLSAGSDVADFTTDVPPALATLALRAAKAIGLRVAGVDIFDVSPGRALSELVIIEVNGNPGIQSLEAVGRDDLVDHIWQTVLRRAFMERGP
jgi:glutathione synthase/RimK-type ligase-like ATP-grasp enzyme